MPEHLDYRNAPVGDYSYSRGVWANGVRSQVAWKPRYIINGRDNLTKHVSPSATPLPQTIPRPMTTAASPQGRTVTFSAQEMPSAAETVAAAATKSFARTQPRQTRSAPSSQSAYFTRNFNTYEHRLEKPQNPVLLPPYRQTREQFASYPTSHHGKQYDITTNFQQRFPPYHRYQTTNQANINNPTHNYSGKAYITKRHFPYAFDKDTFHN